MGSQTQQDQASLVKLESLSTLAGGIAEDFNNLLVGILAHAGLARKALATPSSSALEAARENIEQVEATAMQAANLTKKLLAFSGKAKLSTRPVDLAHLLHEMKQILRGSVDDDVELEMNLTSQLPFIEADPAQIRQLMVHLLTNASDALEGRSDAHLDVGTGIVELDGGEEEEYLPGKLPPGRYIYITVSDTGCGMGEATLAKVFDPFFTTKSSGHGLGLAAVLGIVQGHRGALQVESRLGVGTTVKVLFPCSPSKKQVPAVSQVEKPTPAAATVLVVDDDPTVRKVTHRILTSAGYGVASATDGVQAIERVRELGSEIALVLLDLRMPRMGGAETLDEIRRLRPNLPIIVSSAYDPQEGADGLSQRLAASFLPKPYSPQDLTTLVNWLIEAAKKGA